MPHAAYPNDGFRCFCIPSLEFNFPSRLIDWDGIAVSFWSRACKSRSGVLAVFIHAHGKCSIQRNGIAHVMPDLL